MSRVGEWLETRDGLIVEVEEETKTTYIGRTIEYNEPKPLRYGNRVEFPKKDFI